MKALSLSVVAGLAALTLSACGSVSPQSASAPAEDTSREMTGTPYEDPNTESPADDASAAGTAVEDAAGEFSELEPESFVKNFGDMWEYPGGLQVTITYDGVAQATEWASGAEATGGVVQVFTITIENTSDAPFDGTLAMVDSVTVGEEGMPAEEVYDYDNGWGGVDFSTITPGSKQSRETAFAIDESTTVQMQFSPDWDHEPVIYEGELSL